MLTPPINTLLNKAGSRYSLVIAASKRARQIIDGSDALSQVESLKPVSIATQEIYEEKIECVEAVDVEMARAFLLEPKSQETKRDQENESMIIIG